MRTLWIFPGQGGQRPGMLSNVPRDLLTKVKDLTGVTLNDDEESYKDSIQIQLGILILQLQNIRQLKSIEEVPDVVAGHSLGVFGAAVAAGVLTEEDAIKTVFLRSTKMKEAYPVGYGMGAIVGLTRKEVTSLVEKANLPDVYVSNQNSELQTALSGSLDGINKILALAKDNGAQKAVILKVPNPSHSPLMQSAATALDSAFETIDLKKPKCTYLTNYNGHAVQSVDEVKKDMVNNLIYPVYWDTMMSVASELGIDTTVEVMPGHAFTKLIHTKFPDLRNITMSEMGIDDTEFLLKKWRKIND
ncbi:acyltransferase domain-containing protein [Companilactobacillus allii]|uniref:[acyl-carrier-protein] S-malonyltransferase n=1 Tax=Companilactobacillus allii TaxID=1847728 RepID=A0A1P8Q3C2_9LACO|nr:acyltransferase domain-containing protein [Companilactobacillus allii]APX72338.1 acyl transferase [Companilactobacillus allii]USQ69430.1 acyltransferase domain-containing protein [Companilactobacillus allii]